MLTNIPFELQRLAQWVVAGPDKIPLIATTGQKASPTDPDTWSTFEQASRSGYPHVGFVLSGGDPYCIIDLDNPYRRADKSLIVEGDADWPEAEVRAMRHGKILDAFDSYAELSQSGEGVHIIARGQIPAGVKRDKVEIYSDSRYMICTGNTIKPLAIADCQPLIETLFREMSAGSRLKSQLVQVESTISDEDLYQMASTAANCENFNLLWEGHWQNKYPSQSEADFALLSMLAFYSPDNEQVRRMFRLSALCRAKTAKKDYHLNVALSKIRAMQPQPIDLSSILNETQTTNNRDGQSDGEHGGFEPSVPPSLESDKEVQESAQADAGENGVVEKAPSKASVTFPPGFIGDVAEYIMRSAVRPVPEIALATALALTAGIVGRAYNISGTGLNHYIVLLAPTGRGKEGISRSIDNLMASVRATVPNADQFIGPASFASGQALVRVLDDQKCFVSVIGEFAYMLKAICDPKANSTTANIKKVLLDTYAKSGINSFLRPSVYSDKEKNTGLVSAPNITILGESNPDKFYEALDFSQIAEGFVPRFNIIEYNGPRPKRNKQANLPPSKDLCDKLTELLHIALQMQHQKTCVPVQTTPEALALLDAFDEECDDKINGDAGTVAVEIYNRCHLKALKLSALIAVGISPHQPIVDVPCVEYALAQVRQDAARIFQRFQNHDIGTGEMRAESDALRAICDYLGMSKKKRKEYGVPDMLADKPLVPHGYLRRRLFQLQAYREHKLGPSGLLKTVMRNMVEAEILVMLSPAQTKEFKTTQLVYAKGPCFESRS